MKNSSYLLDEADNGKTKGHFTTSFTTDWPAEEASYMAIYPSSYYKVTGSGADRVVNFSFPSAQTIITGEDGNFASGVMIARAVSTGVPTELSFKNIFSIIKVSLTSATPVTLSNILFKDRSGKPVSGSYTLKVVEPVGGDVPIFPDVSNSDPASRIILDLGESGQEILSTPTDIYVVVPPRVYTDGFTFEFITSDGKKMTKSRESAAELEPGTYYTMSAEFVSNNNVREDLSDGGKVSNCYIVTTAGQYSFDATVIGNGNDGIISGKGFHVTDASIAPASAALLWQDKVKLITDVKLSSDKTKVEFSVLQDSGNAVIVVYDKEDPNDENALLSGVGIFGVHHQ